jgi:hypothetical protein
MSEYPVLTSPLKPGAAAQEVAARYGIGLPDRVATAIAAAVLECADDELRVTMAITAELWGHPEAMKALDRDLRRRMAVDLMEAEMLPTALPRKVVTRSPHPWEPVKVELVVPVRRPA